MNLLLAVLLQRCPRCRKGRVYRGLITMYERCPNCDWQFEREPGYFTGAMYGSYILGVAITFPIWMWMLLTGVSMITILVVTGLILLVALPLMFRYSRVLWMHFDWFFNGPGGKKKTAGA